jgi:hypothetical protein
LGYDFRVTPDQDITNQENETPQEKANRAIENLFAQYSADSGKDSTEGKVNTALERGTRSIALMMEEIADIDGHEEFVDLKQILEDFLGLDKYFFCSKYSKSIDKGAIKEKLLKAKYTGTDIKIYQWAVVAKHVLKKPNRLLVHRAAQFRERRIKLLVLVIVLVEAANVQPLAGELLGQAPGARVAQQAPRLREQRFVAGQLAGGGGAAQFRIRQRRPQEVTQPGFYNIY